MVKRWNRLLVAFFVISDSLFGMIAFVLAYVLRFDAGLIEAPKGYPPFSQYMVDSRIPQFSEIGYTGLS